MTGTTTTKDSAVTERLTSIDPSTSISDYLLGHARERGDKPLYRVKEGERWRDVSATETLDLVRSIAKGLIGSGIQPGDRVAIMSRTRFEWTIADLAIWHAGAVPVPIYETSSPSQAQWILHDAGCTAVFVETPELGAVVEEARSEDDGHDVRQVWTFTNGGFDEVIAAGSDITDEEADARNEPVGLADVSTIIYTSGTTGRPKGTILTHGNFVELSEEARHKLSVVFEKGDTTTLLFIPLAHVFARFVEVLALVEGVPMGHTPDTKKAVDDIGTFQPTLLLSVPRIWEKVYTAAELKQGKGPKRTLFRWAARVSITYSRMQQTPEGPTAAVRAQHKLADRLVYSKLRERLGGKLEWTISGGAPLGERLANFYQGIGLNMLEGYGLTETTAPTNVNLPGRAKMGTVGPPLPGTEIKIAEDGEILARGIGVFTQYHSNPEATAEAIKDGWFHTGDLGSLDDDGYLTITGRKKEIIVTAAGKNVAPSVLEDPLRSHPIISQAVVVGDKQPFVAALITLDPETLPRWLETHDLPEMPVAEAAQNATVREHVQMAIDRANRKVSRAESIREFRILDEDFTIDNDMLTPTMKVKRKEVHENFGHVVDEIYAGDPRKS
ncbi:MAG TPA: AMP-dependent synthetase/ligase [Actinomycetaceae bacterium]|nr:AMP-dependent synthetase/ligase [Actinomycetaceae bacterium]